MRLFIAINLSDDMKDALRAAQNTMRRAGVRGNYTPVENMHLTLAFIGEYPDAEPILDALSAVLPMLGTTFICSGEIVPEVLMLAIPVGSITVAILHANNTRDIETDTRARIRTFPILTSRFEAIRIYMVELILPYVWLLVMTLLHVVSPWTLVTFISLPLALSNCKQMLSCEKEGIKAIATLDEATAKLQLAFSLTLSVGLIIEALT